jgi:hypothetical protein
MSPDTRPTDALAGTLKRTELQRSASLDQPLATFTG